MGYRSSWIAVAVDRRPHALRVVGLRDTGARSSDLETGLFGLALPRWYVALGSGWDFMGKINEAHAQELSAGGQAIFWTADDSSMAARVACYQDGRLLWAFDYDGKPAVTGQLPAEVEAALAEAKRCQAAEEEGVDHLYDVAHQGLKAIVGFRHDETPSGLDFEGLRPIEASEPHRTIQLGGPFRVEGILDPSGRADLIVEATRQVRVDRIQVLNFHAGELAGVVEHKGHLFSRGERRTFALQADGLLRIEISGIFTVRTYEFEADPEG